MTNDGRKRRTKKTAPTERTPKGYEVPIPKRGEFLGNLKKIAASGKRAAGPNKDP